MFKHRLFALACACALGLSACAHEAWQPPVSGHPADPAAEAGSVTRISALERYRASDAETAPVRKPRTESEDDTEQEEPAEHQHGDHMEGSQ